MKSALSAIALGALLACNVATAQVTITQQGTGNGAYTEQDGLLGPDITPKATTIQIGNNNHAGDPVSQTPGIYQHGRFESANARIYQEGDANTANIVQDFVAFEVNATIEQRGAGNTASITQTVQTWSDGAIYQNGTNNLARLEQSVGDSKFSAIQNGSDNRLSVRQMDATFNYPSVTQTGSGNSVTLDVARMLGSSSQIEQMGNNNTVDTFVRDGDGTANSIQQDGNGNTALNHQIGGLPFGATMIIDRSEIHQTGDNNFARVLQDGSNDALIKQFGNDNLGTVVQSYVGPGDPNVGYIKQIGSGYIANLTQSGASNNAGIYQH